VVLAGVMAAAACAPSSGSERGRVPWSEGGHWERIADGPPDARETTAVVWTGKDVLLLGGRIYRPAYSANSPPDPTGDPHSVGGAESSDGARFDPSSRVWSPIAAAPGFTLGSRASAFWTGKEALVLGRTGQGGARMVGGRYDPDLDRWTPMAASGVVLSGDAAWTGEELVVGGTGDGYVAAAAYSPAADRWRELARPPALNGPKGLGGSVWTAVPGGVLYGIAPDLDAPLIYDLHTDRWRSGASVGAVERSGPQHPSGERYGIDVHWTGDVLFETSQSVASGPGSDMVFPQPAFARYDLAADRWGPMKRPPQPPSGSESMVVDHHAVFLPPTAGDVPQVLAYDGRDDRWDTLPAPPGTGTLIWTGTELLQVSPGSATDPRGSVSRLVAD
jgi:hypothetical protein